MAIASIAMAILLSPWHYGRGHTAIAMVFLPSPNTAPHTAAVTSLAKFGASCESLLPSVLVLLERYLMDDDDEVRDRALLYLQVLKKQDRALASNYILNRMAV